MPFFTPILRRGDQLPPQLQLEDKFGGLPWGLPADRWPMCRACGKPQSMICQLQHDAQRLDLGQRGRVLLVFQCNHDPGACETWAAASGANACLVLDASELGTGPSPLPTADTTVETEARVVGWTEGEDDANEPEMVTKLGGAPSWIQGDDEGPTEPWRWIAQLDSTHRFEDGSACDAANYGDLGMAYLYVNTAGDKPAGIMFWQCG
jgi:hypothetical protein